MRAHPRLAEFGVLVAGGLSAAGLGWATLRTWGDAELAARVELERDAERAQQLARLAWERRAADAAAPGGGAGLRATAADLTPPSPRTIRDVAARGERHPFDALLSEAEQARDRAALERALDEHPDAPRRAEGRLRQIQLAVAQADVEGARAAWRDAGRELAPQDARGDVAYLLLDALAAASLLTPEERARAQARLTAEWVAGSLALPTPTDRWVAGRCVLDPRVEVLAVGLEELSPQHAEVARSAADRVGRALRALLAHLGDPALPPADGRWHGLAGLDWLARVDGGGEVALVPYDPPALAREVAAELGPGFTLAGAGDDTGRVVEVAGRALPLHHEGLDALVAAEVGRQRGLRIAFGVLLLFSVAAAALTYAALVRRRRLEALKSRFVAGVSHDLRTPLASILLMAENLESGRVQDAGRRDQYHGAIRREAMRLRRLVDDVLDFSRLERGEGARLAREEVALGPVLDDLERDARERVERAGGALTVRREDVPTGGSLDAEALRRAVGNLVDNALAHSGSTELELAARGEDGALVIDVADRGRGVPVARREALFRPFAQGATGNGTAGGTGLGLAIVRELARAHGGEAAFVDDQAGARVRLRLPLTNPEDEA